MPRAVVALRPAPPAALAVGGLIAVAGGAAWLVDQRIASHFALGSVSAAAANQFIATTGLTLVAMSHARTATRRPPNSAAM